MYLDSLIASLLGKWVHICGILVQYWNFCFSKFKRPTKFGNQKYRYLKEISQTFSLSTENGKNRWYWANSNFSRLTREKLAEVLNCERIVSVYFTSTICEVRPVKYRNFQSSSMRRTPSIIGYPIRIGQQVETPKFRKSIESVQVIFSRLSAWASKKLRIFICVSGNRYGSWYTLQYTILKLLGLNRNSPKFWMFWKSYKDEVWSFLRLFNLSIFYHFHWQS